MLISWQDIFHTVVTDTREVGKWRYCDPVFARHTIFSAGLKKRPGPQDSSRRPVGPGQLSSMVRTLGRFHQLPVRKRPNVKIPRYCEARSACFPCGAIHRHRLQVQGSKNIVRAVRYRLGTFQVALTKYHPCTHFLMSYLNSQCKEPP